MEDEAVVMFLGLFFAAIVMLVIVSVLTKFAKARMEQQRQEKFRQQQADRQQTSEEDKRRSQQELKQRLLQKYGLNRDNASTVFESDEQSRKHQLHVEDSHEHGHLGQEEHYEEIVGSLGEVNDEGCADLAGVRFLATDLAYEIQMQETVDYDRIAQAMVLGEIVNNPRFKSPYSRRR